MPTLFISLADFLEKVESTRKRLDKISIAADFLKNLEPEEMEPAVSMVLGRAFPKWSQITLEVNWKTLSGVLQMIVGDYFSVFSEAFGSTGDVGDAVKAVFRKNYMKKQSVLLEKKLTINEVKRVLQLIAETGGSGSRGKKERLIYSLLSQATPVEAKYLVKIFLGEMRTGLNEGLMEQAVAEAFDIPLTVVQKGTMAKGDIGEVAGIAKTNGEEGLKKIDFRVFGPVELMRAQTAETASDALVNHGGKTAFEYKYDGARIQIHKWKKEIRIFSRRLKDVTKSLPEVVKVAKKNIKADETIIEGEVIAINENGQPIPFQHLMRRFKRIREVRDMAKKIPVRLYLFDILFLNGENLIGLPYLQRRKILAENAGEILLTEQLITDKKEQAEKFLVEAIEKGYEGVMAKKLDSAYTPGSRGKRWFKIKPVLDPLDLVITAAEYGYGRRHGWLSDYSLAARDPITGEFFNVGKTFKGLTDAEMIEMTQRLKELALREENNLVVVLPKVVVEVAYNEIQKSRKYKCGMALRFARITRIRNDKSAEEADTIDRVREIYEKQFAKKGKYKAN